MAVLTGIFVFKPPVPIQTLLVAMIILVMIVGKVRFRDLISAVILHPITAMVAGFIMAGALLITGAFETLVRFLTWLALTTPLGFIGVAVLVIFIPLIFPMPCGRVMVAALLPGVIMFGEKIVEITKYPASFPALMGSFILCCAASCGPSPLGGLGGIGEGNLGLRGGISIKPLQFGILLGVPVVALIVTSLGLSAQLFRLNETLLFLTAGALFGAFTNLILGEKVFKPGGVASGVLVGALMVVM